MKLKLLVSLTALAIIVLVVVYMQSKPGLTANEIPESTETANVEILSAEEKIWKERLDRSFEEVNCPEPYTLDGRYYLGPLIDTHIHVAPLPDDLNRVDFTDEIRPVMGGNVKITDYICMMDHEHTTKAFGFFAVWEPIEPMVQLVNRTRETYGDRFVPFIMPPDHDDRPDGFPTVDAPTLREMLAVNPGLFRGYGEIGLYARGDHGGPTGSPALPPDAPRMLEIYPVVRENKLLVYVHLGEGQQESFERALEANPDINFIFHGDQLIPIKENGDEDLTYIEEILTRHPNVYYGVDELYGGVWLIKPEVSKEEFLAHFADYEPLLERDVHTWKAFIERHPDQVLWGTDRGWSSPWSLDPEVARTLNQYSRAFISQLDPQVQERFAYQNAEKLLA